jgi:hypothetical protein
MQAKGTDVVAVVRAVCLKHKARGGVMSLSAAVREVQEATDPELRRSDQAVAALILLLAADAELIVELDTSLGPDILGRFDAPDIGRLLPALRAYAAILKGNYRQGDDLVDAVLSMAVRSARHAPADEGLEEWLKGIMHNLHAIQTGRNDLD